MNDLFSRYPFRHLAVNSNFFELRSRFFHSNQRATVLVFRTQLAVTHIHVLVFEWSVYHERLIFYCSKHDMTLMAVKGLKAL